MSGGTVLAAAWAALMLAAGWRHRPVATRIAHLGPGLAPSAPIAERWPVAFHAIDLLGRSVRRAARRPVDPGADRWTGLLCLAVVLAAVAVSPVMAVVVGIALAVGRRQVGARQQARSARRVIDELPDVVDLLVLAAGSGLTVPLAVDAVAGTATGSVGEALAEASRRRHLGTATAEAIDGLVPALGEPVRPLATILVNSDRYGTPLVPALEQLAAELRSRRRRRAEEAARRVPVKLIFPLVLCALPAVALLTVVPLLLATLGSLDL